MLSVTIARAWHGARFAAATFSAGVVSINGFDSVSQNRSMSLIRDLTTSETAAGDLDLVPSARIAATPNSITRLCRTERGAAGDASQRTKVSYLTQGCLILRDTAKRCKTNRRYSNRSIVLALSWLTR